MYFIIFFITKEYKKSNVFSYFFNFKNKKIILEKH